MVIIGIFVAIFIFSVIVIIHELWHFWAARFFWVKVEEFGLWIPPKAKVLFTDKKWTKYTLNWLPLWGFVKLTWETPNTFYVYNSEKKLYNNKDLEADILSDTIIFDKQGNTVWETHRQQILKLLQENQADYNLWNKPAWQQAIIILAWVVMNFILAWIIFSVLFFIGMKPIWVNTKIDTDLPVKLIPNYEQALESGLLKINPGLVLSPIEWSVAENAGINNWDILIQVQVCGTSMEANWYCSGWENSKSYIINDYNYLVNILKNNPGKTVGLFTTNTNPDFWKIKWKSHIITIPEDSKIWVYIWENIEINKDFEYKYWFIDSIKYGFYETYNQSLLTFKWIWMLVKKIFNPETPQERTEAIQQVSWPIGIVDFITNSLSAGVKFLFIIAAVISINLWVFNLLPIPALDGWRFIFITLNWLIKKIFWRSAINAQLENIIHLWFFILLIALSLLIAYNDIIKIINN